ncbi:hypothetical protein D3C87_1928930 [compost metagenome]
MMSYTFSRWLKVYQKLVSAPMSRMLVPIAIRWSMMRISSPTMTRMAAVRGVTSMSSMRSTALQKPKLFSAAEQ